MDKEQKLDKPDSVYAAWERCVWQLMTPCSSRDGKGWYRSSHNEKASLCKEAIEAFH